MEFACSVMNYDCNEIPVPEVVVIGLNGPWGLYQGYDKVYLDPVLSYFHPDLAQAILAHEMTHYLDVKLGVIQIPFTYDNVCVTEWNAWRVYNAYVVLTGWSEKARWDWNIQYGCY